MSIEYEIRRLSDLWTFEKCHSCRNLGDEIPSDRGRVAAAGNSHNAGIDNPDEIRGGFLIEITRRREPNHGQKSMLIEHTSSTKIKCRI